MAHIEERKLISGRTSFKAQIFYKVDGKRKKKSETFSSKASAVIWSKKMERRIKTHGGDNIFTKKHVSKTVADAIDRYISGYKGDLKKTKMQILRFVRDGRCAFSDIKLTDVSSNDVRNFAEELAQCGRVPQTVSSYLTHVCYVLSNAEDDFGKDYKVNLDALRRGKKSASRNGLTGKSVPRERRPTLAELDLLLTYFMRRCEGNKACVPMHLIVPFAIFGCRRQSEITGLKWADLDADNILVRATKHPRIAKGKDILTTITVEGQRVIDIHGEQDPTRIFPYNPGTISRLFTNACKLLEIEDLRFHDLRHEGVSWLLEKGWSTRHTMMVSGHSSTQTLDRYSNLKERGDKYEGWPWWDALEQK